MGKLTKEAYVRLCDENMEWLKNQPDCLEKMHIETIVADSPERYYDDKRLIASLEAQLKEREWISVDKELPDHIQNVVVYANDIVMSWRETAWYGNGCWHIADKEEMYIPIITHWMPLPSPPTEKESNPDWTLQTK